MRKNVMQVFTEPDVFKKIDLVLNHSADFLNAEIFQKLSLKPSRDASILETRLHPPKKGLSTAEGRARLMHDLASIELQAMELGLRTLIEFEEAPQGFKEELLAVTVSEAHHLRLCLNEIEDQGFKWGDWPVHLALWNATEASDSLLDRILIVHRYLEGSGLDAGETFMRRMHLLESRTMKMALQQIADEEIGHVEFGSRWYRTICAQEKINPQDDFPLRLQKLEAVLPIRLEPISVDRRLKAGFTPEEIEHLQKRRENILSKIHT